MFTDPLDGTALTEGGAIRGALARLAAEAGAEDLQAAGVPKVSAHGMWGLHGTLAVDSGITSHAVASALGHESFRTTAESYAKREAVAGAQTGARGAHRRAA